MEANKTVPLLAFISEILFRARTFVTQTKNRRQSERETNKLIVLLLARNFITCYSIGPFLFLSIGTAVVIVISQILRVAIDRNASRFTANTIFQCFLQLA